MQFLKLSLVLVSLLSVFGVAAEEEGAKPAAGADAGQSKEQRDFLEKRTKVNTLTSRLEEADRQFKELVKRKAEEHNPEELQAILKQMNENVSERNKTSQQLDKLKSELSMRYPDQGEHLDRNYQIGKRKEEPKVDNAAAGLDEQLTRVKKIIEKKFATFNPEPVPPPAKSEIEAGEDKPKPLRLEK